jgi:hypothetical protein
MEMEMETLPQPEHAAVGGQQAASVTFVNIKYLTSGIMLNPNVHSSI